MLKSLFQQLKKGRFFLQYSIFKTLGEFLQMIVPMGLAIIVVPEMFGVYSLGKMIVFLFASVLVFSTLGPFVVFANQEGVQSGKINKSFSGQLLLIAFSTIFFIAVTLIFNNVIETFVVINHTEFFYLCLAYLGVTIKFFLGSIFLAQNKRAKESYFELFYGLVSVVLVLVYYGFNNITIGSLFFIYFLAAIISLLFFVRYIDSKSLVPLVFDKEHLKKMFHFAKWQIVGSSAVYLVNWGDNFVLRLFVSIDKIGVYNLGYQIFKGFAGLIAVINSYYLPIVSQKIDDVREIKKYLFYIRPRIIVFIAVMIAVFIVCFPFLFKIIYSSDYNGAIIITNVLMIAAVLDLYNIFYVPLLIAAKRYKFAQLTNIIQVSINIALNFVFVPLFGIIGAALATVTAYLVRNAIYETYVFLKFKEYSIVKKLRTKNTIN